MKMIDKPLNVEKSYAVLIPLIKKGEKSFIVLERRSNNISQPNEISFPGGSIEILETPLEAAIRETSEELGIAKNEITVQKSMPSLITPFNSIIYIYVGHLNSEELEPNKDEVAELIYLPVAELENLEAKVYRSEISLKLPADFPFNQIPKGELYPWKTGYYDIYFYEFEKHTIWGITAKILNQFNLKRKEI